MSISKNKISKKNSIIFTDWAANVNKINQKLESFVYEIMIYSLLYDEVLIQDEVFTLSTNIAEWISKNNGETLLSKLLDIGTIKILSFPISRYPEEKYKDMAVNGPIKTRSEYQKHYATIHENKFIPTDNQIEFYHFLDYLIMKKKELIRPVGSLNQIDLLNTFNNLLIKILSLKHYNSWLKSAFKRINNKTIDEFIEFINYPEKAVTKLHDNKLNPKVAIGKNSEPLFTRSLGYQITKLYHPSEAKAIQSLIQTTYAAPFCWNENGVGRYSKLLRELPLLSTDNPTIEDNLNPYVSVQSVVNIPLSLPAIETDFIEIIQKVRESKSGKKLRKSIKNLGKDIDFNIQNDCWKAVSDELASLVEKKKQFNIKTSVLKFGRTTTIGAVVSSATASYFEKQLLFNDSLENILNIAIGGSLYVMGSHFYDLLIYDLKKQKYRQFIEGIVDFRCTPIPQPKYLNIDTEMPS